MVTRGSKISERILKSRWKSAGGGYDTTWKQSQLDLVQEQLFNHYMPIFLEIQHRATLTSPAMIRMTLSLNYFLSIELLLHLLIIVCTWQCLRCVLWLRVYMKCGSVPIQNVQRDYLVPLGISVHLTWHQWLSTPCKQLRARWLCNIYEPQSNISVELSDTAGKKKL